MRRSLSDKRTFALHPHLAEAATSRWATENSVRFGEQRTKRLRLTPLRINITLNWFEELKQPIPVK
ncbi:MAG: hypothetical protein DMG12_15640 [Acidobacteria bacterium]|nr:MAG: hypothetical protein DMG12_15640 [Acidobacteriota bacterium]